MFFAANAQNSFDEATSQVLANQILENPRITLASAHASGIDDDATALANIKSLAAGKEAERSSYEHDGGTGPGGTTPVAVNLLAALLAIASEHAIGVSEIAGGVHSDQSMHYEGRAIDLNWIDGVRVKDATKAAVDSVRGICISVGALKIFGPGDEGHENHIHCEW